MHFYGIFCQFGCTDLAVWRRSNLAAWLYSMHQENYQYFEKIRKIQNFQYVQLNHYLLVQSKYDEEEVEKKRPERRHIWTIKRFG